VIASKDGFLTTGPQKPGYWFLHPGILQNNKKRRKSINKGVVIKNFLLLSMLGSVF
jgi:hypothetical protein